MKKVKESIKRIIIEFFSLKKNKIKKEAPKYDSLLVDWKQDIICLI